MSDAFVDTSGWASWVKTSEPHYDLAGIAVESIRNSGGKLFTSSYILAELTALFARMRIDRLAQFRVIETIRTEPSVEIIDIEPQFISESWLLWKSRPDKDWTLVDCSSFVLMESHGLTEALTTDRHFEQAGFVRLLR